MSDKTKRVLTVNDTHCGSALGLIPPRYHDGDYSSFQAPFWNFYLSSLEQIGPVDLAVFNGDLIEGPGKKDNKLHIRTDPQDQAKIAAEALKLVEAKKRIIVRGTGYHVGTDSNYEDIVGSELGVAVQDEARAEIYGRKIQWRHVVGRSDTPYGQYTQDAKELINELLQSDFEDYPAADVVLRAHVHYCTAAMVADGTRGIIRQAWSLPAMQLRGPRQSSYVRGLRTWLYHVGITLIEIEPNGEVFVRPILMPIKTHMRRNYIHV